MEAVKKFSRIRVSIAAICCSPAAFMYAAWMMSLGLGLGLGLVLGLGEPST